MNNRQFLPIAACILLALLAGWFLYNHYSNPKRIILNRLENLASVSSMEGEFNPISAIKDVNLFRTFFFDPVVVDTKYGDIVGTHDQEDMKGLFLYSRESANSILLEFKNTLILGLEKESASCRTDAELTIDFKPSRMVKHSQPLVFHWKKDNGKWKIHKIEPYLPQDEIEE